ncbi:MAG: DUF3769 domain-containing protein, partial [Microcystaceae cyanobacterium]
PASSGESAEALGAPISVGENPSPKATLNRFQVGEPSVSSSPQKLIVPGLNQDGVSANLSAAKVLVTQVRNGAVQKFDLSDPAPKQDLLSQSIEAQTQSSEATPTQEEEPVQVVEVISDRQEYNPQQQVVTAQGNVIMRFAKAVMRADRLQVNLSSRVAVAEGNVVLKRGEQSLWGDRFEYYFVQDSGIILNARGEINQPAAGRDLSNSELIPDQPLTDRLAQRQPLQQITSTGGYQFSAGSTRDISLVGQQGSGGIVGTSSGGQINHIRFEAERIDFYPEGWDATNIRMTNDPFSPPEFEVRADTAKLRNVEPLVDEVILSNSRLVFDQGFSPPIFQNRLVFDRRPRQPGLFQIGFDGDDRGGFFIERPFYLIATEKVSFRLAPQ